MGKAGKALTRFIEDLPDSKLSGYMDGEHTLHKDTWKEGLGAGLEILKIHRSYPANCICCFS